MLEAGDHDFAISRAYYAMFYVARALLLTRDVRRSKHSDVLAALFAVGLYPGLQAFAGALLSPI